MIAVLFGVLFGLVLLAGVTGATRPRISTAVLRRAPWIMAVSLALFGTIFLYAVPADSRMSNLERTAQVVGGTVALGALALGIFLFGVNLAGFDPDATSIADKLATDSTSQQLFARWTHRVRWRRWIGGVTGLLIAIVSGGNVLVGGIGGAALGSLSAELHLCRPQRRSTRVATLERRQMRDYIGSSTYALGAIALIAIGVMAWAMIAGRATTATMWWASLALIAMVIAAVMTWRVVMRRRPALATELIAADDLLRRLAVTNGIAHPMISAGLVLLSTGFARSDLDALAFVFGLGAVVVWWRNRRGGLDYLLKRPAKAAHLITPVS